MVKFIMNNATPLPWKYNIFHKEGDAERCGIFAEPFTGHAYSVARCPDYQTKVNWNADAAFIITACNSYNDLVEKNNKHRELLERLIMWASRRCPCDDDSPRICPLCDADIEKDRCKAIESTFPNSLLHEMRSVLKETV